MVALIALQAGEQGVVTTLNTQDETIVNKLFAMGISPGVTCLLEQRFPAFIVKVGRSRAALDRDIAALIEVQPLPPLPKSLVP